MRDCELLILTGRDVASVLAGRELELIDLVRGAYVAHEAGDSSLPHSTFLNFPDQQKNRIIALPAFLGGKFGVAGVKWVSSFPDNLQSGLDRASAAVILNSPVTGRSIAILEGSIISAKRTAASAALAAQVLLSEKPTTTIGMIGGGLINFEVARFLLAVFPELASIDLFDTDPKHGTHFQRRCQETLGIVVRIAKSVESVLQASSITSIATTVSKPHIDDLSVCKPGSTILHVSLRDLSAEVILTCDNIVDDIDHVCRAQTSVHLAEQLIGNRSFIRCSLANILNGTAPARANAKQVAVFSPFGLGVLDLAVSKLVYELGRAGKLGTVIESFLPDSWAEQREERQLHSVV